MNSENDDSASPSSGEPEPPFCSSSDATQSTTRASNPTHKRKAGRKKFRETRHPVYRGVRQRNGQKWVCEVREPNKKSRIWLGTFASPDMAARAYDVAALALRGKSAPLNFPDSAWSLPRAESSSARDIRLAVIEATKSDRLTSPSSSSSNVELLDPGTPRNVLGGSEDSKKFPEHSETLFLDEEVLFNMPVLLDSMAEGLLITPPGMQKRMDPDDVYSDMELSLWND